MGIRTWIEGWPVYRQLTGEDPLGRGAAAKSARSAGLVARTETAKEVTALHRLYGIVEDTDLAYAVDLAAVGQPLQPHLSARLSPVAGQHS